MMAPNDVWSGVCTNNWFRTTFGFASFLSSMTMRMPSRSDSSRRSEMPATFPSRTRSAIFSSSDVLLTWNGISVTTRLIRPALPSSTCTLERIFMLPRPFR